MDKSYELKTADIEHTYVKAINIVWHKVKRKLGELLCRPHSYLLSCIVECNTDVLLSFTLDVQQEKHCCHEFVAYFFTSESSYCITIFGCYWSI